MKEGKTVLVVAVLLLSFSWGFSTVGIATAQDMNDPVLAVGWQVVNTTEDISHQEQQSEWLFGPQPVVWIGYASDWTWNGTKTSEYDFQVNPSDQLLVNISIPWEFIEAGTVLDSVAFWGEMRGVRYAVFGMEYNVSADAWNHLSLSYQAGDVAMPAANFMTLHTEYCTYVNDTLSHKYKIEFAISFTNAEIGVFKTGMHVLDTDGNPVSPSWLARVESGTFETPPIGVGAPVTAADFVFPRYYYAEITDSEGDILHYVKDDEFTFRMLSNYPFGEVLVPFCVLTWDDDYTLNESWVIKDDIWKLLSTETVFDEMPLLLFFQYNSTGQYLVGGHLTNVVWNWNWVLRMWLVTYDIVLDYDIDVGRFYNLLAMGERMGGSELYWTGHFTEYVDMHPDPYIEGAIVEPIPYFWTVRDANGRQLTPRSEIERKNTVQMAYRQAFVEAFVRNPMGDIVERAMPGQVFNITLDVHAPGELINGTTAIFVNETNVWVPEVSNFVDIDTYYVNRTLLNVAISFVGYGSGYNTTHSWDYVIVHIIQVDFVAQVMDDMSIKYTEYSSSSDIATAATNSTEYYFDMVDSLDWSINIGPELTTLQLGLSLTGAAPDAVINQVASQAEWWEDYAVNASLAGQNNFTVYHDPAYSKSVVEKFDEEIIWSPARLVFGDIPIWEEPLWTVTEEGALDLDGNMFTTEDQYFVRRTGSWEHWGNTTVEGMGVTVIFDPTPGRDGDEFWSESWQGVVKTIINYSASEEFYWYHAYNWSLVGVDAMDSIMDTLWADYDGDIP
ncbi:MAG: hypothetical protein ACFE8Z_05825, partial [Candidatus Hermodarchaeota archaeon]